jgi:hypothetical protein
MKASDPEMGLGSWIPKSILVSVLKYMFYNDILVNEVHYDYGVLYYE